MGQNTGNKLGEREGLFQEYPGMKISDEVSDIISELVEQYGMSIEEFIATMNIPESLKNSDFFKRKIPENIDIKDDAEYTKAIVENNKKIFGNYFFPVSNIPKDKKLQAETLIKVNKGGFNFSQALTILHNPYFYHFTNLYNILIKFDFLFHKARTSQAVRYWYYNKHWGNIIDESILFSTRIDIESCELILAQYRDNEEFGPNLDIEFFRPYLETLIIRHYICVNTFLYGETKSRLGFKKQGQEHQIVEAYMYLYEKNKEIEEGGDIEINMLHRITGEKVHTRQIAKFKESGLGKAIIKGVYTHEGKEKSGEVPIPFKASKVLTYLYFSGAIFLGDEKFFYTSRFVLQCITDETISIERIEGFKKMVGVIQDDASLVVISVLGLENISCLAELTKNHIEILSSRFISLDGNTPHMRYDLSGLFDDISFEEFELLLFSDDTIIEHLLENPEDTKGILQKKHILGELHENLGFLHTENKAYIGLSLLANETPVIEVRLQGIQRELDSLYSLDNAGKYINFHRELDSLGYDIKDILTFGSSIYKFCEGCFSEYKLLMKEFLDLSEWLQSKTLVFLKQEKLSPGFSDILGLLKDFSFFLNENEYWEEDFNTSFELFIEVQSKQRQKPIIREDTTQNIWPEHFSGVGSFVDGKKYTHETQSILIKMLHQMNIFFYDEFISFLYNYEQEIGKLDESLFQGKVLILYKVIRIFQKLNIHTLDSSEKLFHFIFFQEISLYDLEILNTKTEGYEDIMDYKTIVGKVMKFLKYRDKNILDISYEVGEENDEEADGNDEKKVKRKKNRGKNKVSEINPNTFSDQRRSKLAYGRLKRKYKSGNNGDYSDEMRKIIRSDILYDIKVYSFILARYEEYKNSFEEGYLSKLLKKVGNTNGHLPLSDLIPFARILLIKSELSQEQKGYIFKVIEKELKAQNGNLGPEDFSRVIFSCMGLGNSFNVSMANFITWFVEKSGYKKWNYNAQDIYMILQGLYDYRDIDCVNRVVQHLFSQIGNLSDLSSTQLISLKIVYSLYGINNSQEFEEEYRKAALDKQYEGSSTAEDYLYNEIKKIFPDAVQGHFIDGFELDIFIPSLGKNGVNIEFDGKIYHTDVKKVRTQRRDNYIGKTKKIDVYRLSSEKHSELQAKARGTISYLHSTYKKDS